MSNNQNIVIKEEYMIKQEPILINEFEINPEHNHVLDAVESIKKEIVVPKEQPSISKYWDFSCNIKNDFLTLIENRVSIKRLQKWKGFGPIYRFSTFVLNNNFNAVYIKWAIDGNKIKGYVEFNVPISFEMLKNVYGRDINATITTQKNREKETDKFYQEIIN